jgi:hypothetical protein
MKKNTLLFSLTIAVFQVTNAQTFKYIHTGDFDKLYYSDSIALAEIRQKEISHQAYLNDFIVFEGISPKRLPIVFNVITSKTKKIEINQILYQIEVLNNCFNNGVKMPDDDIFKNHATNAELSFCLSDIAAPFVNFKEVEEGFEFENFLSMKNRDTGIEAYEPESYINIWVCDLKNQMSGNVVSAGYAQLPFRGIEKDGIVIDIDYFGKQDKSEFYKNGHTLVNLVGTYLGLLPIYGMGAPCESDLVDDTPTPGAPSFTCNLQTEVSVAFSGCGIHTEKVMTRNFMDNIPDDCSTMFSLGQVRRMHSFLGTKGFRKNLLSTQIPPDCYDSRTNSINDYTDYSHKLSISPNPALTSVKLEYSGKCDDNNCNFKVINALGQVVLEGKFLNHMTLDCSNFKNGVFNIILQNGKINIQEAFVIIN